MFSTKIYFSFSTVIPVQTRDAIAAPRNGATINNHSWESAAPPSKIAGPILLAGFTEVPVIGIQTIWTNTRDKPIASPANLFSPFLAVTPSTTNTNINVNTVSATKATDNIPSGKPFAPVRVVVDPDSFAKNQRIDEPIIAPITWKIIYITASLPLILPDRKTPKVIAGFIWQPEILPIVYAIATTDKPKANATPSVPTDRKGCYAPAKTAAPQPISTSTIVPINSAKYLFMT